MSTVGKDDLERIRRRIISANNQIQKSKGMIEQNCKELMELIGTSDLEEAKKIRDSLIKEIEDRTEKLKQKLKEFDDAFNKYINNPDEI